MIKMDEAMISNIGDGAMSDYMDGTGYEDSLREENDEGKNCGSDASASDENVYNEDIDDGDLDVDEEKEEFDPEAEITALKESFPELSGIDSLGALKNPEKYEKFRRMGLTPTEAYMASGEHRLAVRGIPASPLSVARRTEGIPDRQLRMAREIFTGLTDVEIQALYKRVTK